MFGLQPDPKSHDAFVGFRAVYDSERRIVICPDRVSRRSDGDETSHPLLDILIGDEVYGRMKRFVQSAVPYAFGLCDDVYTLEYPRNIDGGCARITIKARASGEYLYVSMYADGVRTEGAE